ncbi:MAG: hypothetical protein ACKOA9_06970 [Actinomycetota bacterium]
MTATTTILDPRVLPPGEPETPTWSVDGGLEGKIVGLRLDQAWRSYIAIVEEWERRFAADGARVEVWWAGERVGAEGEQTRADLDEWSRLVDIGVVGLGN